MKGSQLFRFQVIRFNFKGASNLEFCKILGLTQALRALGGPDLPGRPGQRRVAAAAVKLAISSTAAIHQDCHSP